MRPSRPVAPRFPYEVLLVAAVLVAAVLVGGVAPRSAQAAEGAPSSKLAEAAALYDLWVGEQLAYHQIPGVVVGVVSGGELVWAKGYGTSDLAGGVPLSPATPFRIGSVSKLFTATAILQLRDAGKLALDDPIARHLPWFVVRNPFPNAPQPTIEQLLTHTSGLPREGPFAAWTTHRFPSREQLRAALPEIALISPPGKSYRYSNLGMALLGEVVMAVSGESWPDYVKRHIAGPLGMRATTGAPTAAEIAALPRQHRRKQPDGSRGTLDYYETGAIAPAAAIVSTVEDLARFAALQLTEDATGGNDPRRENGTQILSPATLAEMHRPHVVYPSWTGGRGLGFAVSRRDGRTYVSHGGWIGGHRADLVLDLDRKLAVVALTNADDASPGLFARKALDLLSGALSASPSLPQAAAPDPAWQRYLGLYTDPWDWEIQVMLLDGALVLYEHGYPPEDDPAEAITRLTPAGEHTFKLADGELLRFELGADGQVTKMFKRGEYYLPKGKPRP